MICKNCGSRIADGQGFCGSCGTRVESSETRSQTSIQSMGEMSLHCPRCGKTNLQVQSNNKVVSSMTMAHSIGRKHAIGNTAYNTQMETYWFCSSCGMRFRDLDELKQLSQKLRKWAKILKIILIICAVFSIILAVGAIVDGSLGIKLLLIFYVLLDLLLVAIWLYISGSANKNETEYKELLPKVRKR